jgi:hypothetical protein
MSFLELAKQADARLRTAKGAAPPYAVNAVNAVSGGLHGVVPPPVDNVTAYCAAMREFWRLVALGPAVDRGTAIKALNEVIRLVAEVGEPTATELRHRLEAEWHREAGRCARCGESGERHT